jgi:predicted TPR repeat methyltransferase
LVAVDLDDRDMLEACGFERRLFDEFELASAPDATARDALTREFFAWIADRYDRVVDVARNQENIGALLRMVVAGTPTVQGPIVDFGCGSGLSASVAQASGISIVGVDRSEAMTALALRRGLPTASFAAFSEAKEHFRGAISSYVLHFRPPESDLAVLWDSVRPGGLLAANIHKSRGLTWAVESFQRLGALTEVRDLPAPLQRHGPYLTVRKPQ